MLLILPACLHASQLVLTGGYAYSGAPHTGADVASGYHPVVAGSGFTFGVRADIDNPSRRWWFSPSFLYWSNLTGAPDPNSKVNYFQAEVGGRALIHTPNDPKFYGGVGLGYSLSHGVKTPKAGGDQETYDADFPSASLHAGVKTLNIASGISFLGELSYHFGLLHPHSHLAIGPANAILVQVGMGFDLLSGAQP